MAIPTLNAVGFCANYSKQGDWAFDYALELSRRFSRQLNVFHFLTNPYDPADKGATGKSVADKTRMAIEKERELRMYYDTRAGEYLEVGFRLCEDNEWTELHRCLVIREFQILVLGYPEWNATFAGRPIEEFAHSFVCPVVLVGPERPDQFHLNPQASLISVNLGLPEGSFSKIELETA